MDIKKEAKKYWGLDSLNLNDADPEYFKKFYSEIMKLEDHEIVEQLMNILEWHTVKQLSEGNLNKMYKSAKVQKILNSAFPKDQ